MSASGEAVGSPPGWYPTAGGWMWWDGYRWLAPAARPPDPANERNLALFAHLSAFVGGAIVSGIIWGTSQGKPYARRHACEAFNFALTFLGLNFVLMASFFVAFSLIALAPPVGIVLIVVVGLGWLAAFTGHLVWAIQGAMAASRGQEWRYPVSLRLVKD